MAAAEYAKILAQRQKEAKEAKELKRRRFVIKINTKGKSSFSNKNGKV